MTEGHIGNYKNQSEHQFRGSKSMCRFINLTQRRSCCSYYIAQNSFVGKGLVLGMTRGCLHMYCLVYITQMSQRAGKEIFEDNKDIAFV